MSVSPIICTKGSDNLNPTYIYMYMFMYFDTISRMQLQLLCHKLNLSETFNRFCFAG